MVDLFGFLMLVIIGERMDFVNMIFATIEDDYAVLLLKVAPSCQKLVV